MRGRDIKRYGYDFADLWLINVHNGIKSKNIPPVDINKYPAIKKHLNKYYLKLAKRADKGDSPYNLRNCVYMDDFSKQKIVWKRIGSILRFGYDENCCMTLDSTCFAIGKHIKYLTAVLNTYIGNYLFKDSPQTGTGDLIVSVQAFEPVKIPMPTTTQELEIINVFDKIHDSNYASIRNLDMQLEEYVSCIFGFTQKEHEFIINFSSKHFRQ